MPSRSAIRPRSRAPPPIVSTRSGRSAGHRNEAAVIARMTPCRRPERRLGRLLGEMGDRDDLLRRGEQQQQLVRAQVERGHPPRLAMRRRGERQASGQE